MEPIGDKESDDMSTPFTSKDGSRVGFLRQLYRKSLKKYLWIVILGLWAGMLALGYIGLSKSAISRGETSSPLDLIYLTLQLVMFESGSVPGPVPWQLEIARFALPALAAYTAFQALAVLFREQTKSIRLKFIHDHIVVCGLSRKGHLLTQRLLEQGYKVVAIELDERHDLIEPLQAQGAIILKGDATDRTVLRQAAVQRAKYLLAVCDDGTNAEIAVRAQSLIDTHTRDPLTCIIHIVDPRLCDLLREKEIGGKAFPGLRLELFNVFERGAQLILEEFPPFDLQNEKIFEAPHILLIGMGRMGESLLTRIGHAWYSKVDNSNNPLSLTVVDLKASEKLRFLEKQYPRLSDCCEIQAFSLDIHSSEFYNIPFLTNRDNQCNDIAYVCFDNDPLGLHVGLHLERLMKKSGTSIVIRMLESHGLGSLLGESGEASSGFHNIHAFNLLDKTCTPELLFGGIHEMLARSVHEDYVRQRKRLNESIKVNSTLVPWDQLPERTKDSNRRYADHICIKVEAINCYLTPLKDWDASDFVFTEQEVNLMASMEHERWFQEQTLDGWTFGKEKDESRKTHPSLLGWGDLPESEKEKNRDFIRDLPSILSRAGFQIQRVR
jgi:hypothetical protein